MEVGGARGARETGDTAALALVFRHLDGGVGTGVCCVSCTGPRAGLWPIRGGWWTTAPVGETAEAPQVWLGSGAHSAAAGQDTGTMSVGGAQALPGPVPVGQAASGQEVRAEVRAGRQQGPVEAEEAKTAEEAGGADD